MSGDVAIRPEEEFDRGAVRAILEAAFKGPAEAHLVEALRAQGDIVSSLVGVETAPTGIVVFSALRLPETPQVRACALAPLAVLPSHQNQGIGTSLVQEGLGRLRISCMDLVLVLGEPAYYGRFGFSAEAARSLKTPYDGPYLQAVHLSERGAGAKGAVLYAPAFADLG